MKIEPNKVVSIHYTLTLDNGELVDTTQGEEPLNYLAGAGNIIPGLDKALMGCSVGESKKVKVQPEDGYGEYDQELVQSLPKEMFTGIDNIEVGMEFQTQGEDGGHGHFVIVTAVEDDTIVVDGNHEFAGKVLNFDVTIAAIRDADPSELNNGQVH